MPLARKVSALAATLAALACATGAAKPGWLDTGRDPRFESATYLSAVGMSDDAAPEQARHDADVHAQAAIASQIRVDIRAAFSSSQREESAGGSSAESAAISDQVESVAHERLAGLFIAERWTDPQTGRAYSLAVLERATALRAVDGEASGRRAALAGLKRDREQFLAAGNLGGALHCLREEYRQSLQLAELTRVKSVLAPALSVPSDVPPGAVLEELPALLASIRLTQILEGNGDAHALQVRAVLDEPGRRAVPLSGLRLLAQVLGGSADADSFSVTDAHGAAIFRVRKTAADAGSALSLRVRLDVGAASDADDALAGWNEALLAPGAQLRLPLEARDGAGKLIALLIDPGEGSVFTEALRERLSALGYRTGLFEPSRVRALSARLKAGQAPGAFGAELEGAELILWGALSTSSPAASALGYTASCAGELELLEARSGAQLSRLPISVRSAAEEQAAARSRVERVAAALVAEALAKVRP